MARTVNTDHRQALLKAAARHLVDHGIADQSLSDIAAGIGTSARMLIHHFGTRDALVARALEIARQWQLDEAEQYLQPAADAVAVLRATWSWLVDDQTLSYFRLFQQIAALERLQGADAPTNFSAHLGEDWQPLLFRVFEADPRFDDAASFADLTIAFYRGLALDLVHEANRSRHRQAFERFIELLGASPQGGAGSSRPHRGGGRRERRKI